MEDQSTLYTLDEAFSTIKFGKYQIIVLAIAGLGWVAEAMEIMLLSFVGPKVKSEWGLSSNQESLITTVVFAGMLFGAYSWGFVSDTYGRIKSLLGVSIVTTVAGLLSAFSLNYGSLVTLRLIVGFGLGGGHVFSSWFLEFVPAPNRGTWMVIFSTFWTIGTIMEAGLAWIVMPRLGWRWLLGLSSIPSLSFLLLYGLISESPRYLIMKGKTDEAYQVLQKIASLNKTRLPSGTLVSDQSIFENEKLVPSEDTNLISSTKSYSGNVLLLFSSKLIRTTLLLWVVYFGNTFAYYGIVLLTSQLSSSQSQCGSSPLMMQNDSDSYLYINVFVTSCAELPGLALAAVIVDKVGRKCSMEIMLLSGFVLLLPLVSNQNEVLTTVSLFGARMFISASFIVACIYAPEVYPTSVRSTGVGVATAIGRVGGMICPLVAVALVSSCHQATAIILFELVLLLVALSVMFFPFETKGKELVDTVLETSRVPDDIVH